eukprot:4734148-Amphidinium_carterae.1
MPLVLPALKTSGSKKYRDKCMLFVAACLINSNTQELVKNTLQSSELAHYLPRLFSINAQSKQKMV